MSVTWNVNRLTGRYLDELARRPEAAGRLADLLRVSPLPSPFAARLLTRPALLEASERRQLESDLMGIYALLTSLPDRLFGGDVERFALAIGFDPMETRLALRSGPDWPPPLVGRVDLYRDRAGFRLLELNLGTALGGFQVAEVNRLMLRADVVRGFAKRERLTFVDTMSLLADMMHRRHRGSSSPVVALCDAEDSYAHWEAMLHGMAAQFRELGIDARPCHVGQLRAASRGLTLDGAHVDIVFRYFALAQATANRKALAQAETVVRACERGEVDLFTPLTTTLLSSKQALVLLSDERHREAFSSDELALVDRFLPWTRELRDGTVHVDGAAVNLREHCLRSRENLILKPGHLYGGIGVVPGWTVDDGEWRAALDQAWNGPYIVQRRVVPAPEPFPDLDTGELAPWLVLWGPFVAGEGLGGCFIRCSRNLDDGVVSFDHGAWVGTAFHAES